MGHAGSTYLSKLVKYLYPELAVVHGKEVTLQKYNESYMYKLPENASNIFSSGGSLFGIHWDRAAFNPYLSFLKEQSTKDFVLARNLEEQVCSMYAHSLNRYSVDEMNPSNTFIQMLISKVSILGQIISLAGKKNISSIVIARIIPLVFYTWRITYFYHLFNELEHKNDEYIFMEDLYSKPSSTYTFLKKNFGYVNEENWEKMESFSASKNEHQNNRKDKLTKLIRSDEFRYAANYFNQLNPLKLKFSKSILSHKRSFQFLLDIGFEL
ncbi:hypothetical protein [Synechococcus sp. A15-28]|uniref:hypothetical protein n=1 Tax=Synechococcus sp. A15-28 TaxID=1050638 RepID=UPI00164521BD|nr:hypothetical protein [Synechococcus sp. A15-28]